MKREEDPIPEWGDSSRLPDSGFEHYLRQQSLGSVGDCAGEVLYQCGYAAGLAAAKQASSRIVHRWQRISLSAVAMLVASLGLQAWWLPDSRESSYSLQESVSAQVDRVAQDMPEAADKSGQQPMWGMFVRTENRDEQQGTVLRASMRHLPEQPQMVIPVVEATETSKILRPQDFQLLLKEEV